MQTLPKTPVTFTQQAVSAIKRMMADENFDTGKFLRIGVKGGGCSGMTYLLDFDARKEKDDYFDIDGIPCIINPAHLVFLKDMEIDFGTGLEARGFIFKNPNASTTCGCGSSFGV